MTPIERLNQSRAKFRIIAAREMREWVAGERGFLPGCLNERITLDAIKTAYAAGLRDAQGIKGDE